MSTYDQHHFHTYLNMDLHHASVRVLYINTYNKYIYINDHVAHPRHLEHPRGTKISVAPSAPLTRTSCTSPRPPRSKSP